MQAVLQRYFAAVLVVVMLASNAAAAVAQTPVASPIADVASFEADTCMFPVPNGFTDGVDAFCGWVTAPMYPDGRAEGVVKLPVIRLASTAAEPSPTPLIILLGGPGQDATPMLTMFDVEHPVWNFFLERQDVILFDQRGMGMSEPNLECEIEALMKAGEEVNDMAFLSGVLGCGNDLKNRGIDPSAFTTRSNAADVEAIRVAMGYEQVDLYAVSYGTKLALSMIRDYPDSVRSAILSSPMPLEANPLGYHPIAFSEALSALWAACAADDVCAAANPDPAGDLLIAVDRLTAEPAQLTTLNIFTGEPEEMTIDATQFMDFVNMGVYSHVLAPVLPYLVTQVARGDDDLLSRFAAVHTLGGTSDATIGASFTYTCQDEVPFNDTRQSAAEAEAAGVPTPLLDGTWTGMEGFYTQVCRAWAFPEADPIENEPVSSDVPILVIVGALDPSTPPSYGEQIVERFPNGQLVIVAAGGHDPAPQNPACFDPMMLGFLTDPTAEIDATCADAPIEFPAEDEIRLPWEPDDADDN